MKTALLALALTLVTLVGCADPAQVRDVEAAGSAGVAGSAAVAGSGAGGEAGEGLSEQAGAGGAPDALGDAGEGGMPAAGGTHSGGSGTGGNAGTAGAGGSGPAFWEHCGSDAVCADDAVCGEFLEHAGEPLGNRVCTFSCWTTGNNPHADYAAEMRCKTAGGVCYSAGGGIPVCVPHEPQ